MRLSARDLGFQIATTAELTQRPIRLRIGGMTYCLEPAEALEMAGQLADAIDTAKSLPTKENHV